MSARCSGPARVPARCLRSRRLAPALRCSATADPPVAPGSLVGVAGATGGVGQLIVATLLATGYRVRGLVRDPASAAALLSHPSLTLVAADLRRGDALEASGAAAGLDALIVATGTTAFPSARWKGGNTPVATDALGVANLVAAARAGSPGLALLVLVSSVGVLRADAPPYSILNAFGVLDAKASGEAALRASGLPHVILRPARLTDGPYTSYDLNTLLRATSGEKRAPLLALGDTLSAAQCSRLVVAAAAVAALASPAAVGRAFDVGSADGEPVAAGDAARWEALFAGARRCV